MYRQNIVDGVVESFIKSDKFKTTVISVSFYLKATAQTVAVNALVGAMMSSSTIKYSDTVSLKRYLDNLYGAVLTNNVKKNGDYQEINLTLSVLDDCKEGSGSLFSAAVNLLNDMIFERYFSDVDYPVEILEREKRLQSEQTLGMINDKRLFSRQRCEEEVCKEEPFGLPVLGTVEQIENIDAKALKSALKRIIETAYVSIKIIGKTLPEGAFTVFEDNFKKVQREFAGTKRDIVRQAGPVRTVADKLDVTQGKLVLGFRSDSAGADAQTVPVAVMADIFGGGPHSKLFLNVREKQSLCYYCSARPVRRKGLMFVESGVEGENILKAKQEILNQFNQVKAGCFTQEDLDTSIRSLCAGISMLEDDSSSLDLWYSARFDEQDPLTPKQYIEILNRVTKQQVVDAAQKFELDTVYILEPTEDVTHD
ncbi:MAG: pitrilysin family protein [bacterium]|nr:pitrilysin family protein [bacterium]